VKFNNINMTCEGLIPRVQRSFLSRDREALQPHIRAFVVRAVTFTACQRRCAYPPTHEHRCPRRIGTS
jgi:hypothetical protein